MSWRSFVFFIALGLLVPQVRSARAEGSSTAFNPCDPPDPGFRTYAPWIHGLAPASLLAPRSGGLTPSGQFDLLVHFHGADAARKSIVRSGSGLFVLGVDAGIGSGAYRTAFASPKDFETLLERAEYFVAEHAQRKRARIRHIALSAWSAGYGAVGAILTQKVARRVDAVILLDGLHADYAEPGSSTPKGKPLVPFIDFAKQALRGDKEMLITHSEIVPPGYASTSETSAYVLEALGVRTKPAKGNAFGLELFTQFRSGDLGIAGYRGKDKPAHCAHLQLLRDIVPRLEKSWKTPPAKTAKAKRK